MATTNLTGDFTLYKVQDCAFSISDTRAAKTINEFGSSKFSLIVAEDSLPVKEKIVKSMSKKTFETTKVTDKFKCLFSKKALEAVGLNEKRTANNAKRIVESTWIADNPGKVFEKNAAEVFAISEKTAKSLNLNKRESVNFVDVFSRVCSFSRPIAEGVLLVDRTVKSLNKQATECLRVDGKSCSRIIINRDERLAVADFFDKDTVFFLDFAEDIAVVARANRDMGVNCRELFTMSSAGFRIYEVLKKESVSVVGSFVERSMFIREFAERIYSSSKTVKEFGLSQKEFFEFDEAYIRHANAVVSDISLCLGEMTLQDFLDKTSSPPGYDKFIDFIVGEYEYQDALVRMAVEAGAAKAEPLIYDMSVNIDIDDTVDRGTAQITDITKPTAVKFNKHYYHPPEVGVTLKGGTGTDIITVEIVEIREYGFDVSLYNGNRVRVTGFVTWTAVGY